MKSNCTIACSNGLYFNSSYGGTGSKCYYKPDDGIISISEECDDGNLLANDGCTSNKIDTNYECTPTAKGSGPSICILKICGNAKIDGTEECDLGTKLNIESNGCVDCKPVKGWKCKDNKCSVIFGDGIRIKPQEECDDKNLL